VRGVQERRVVVAAVTAPRPAWLAAAVAAAVIAADQLTKSWALGALTFGIPRHVFGPLSWSLTINRGAAFGLGTGITPILEVVAVVLVTALAVAAQRAGHRAGWVVMVALGLLLGGALSNLGDRVFRSHHGGVVDFIDALRIGGHDRWPIFNLADASITVGAVLLVVAASRQRAAERAGGADPSSVGGRPPGTLGRG
jgi:signal peptidase II